MAQRPLYNSNGERDSPKRATISLPLKDYNKLEKMANKKRVSIAWIIREAVNVYITGENK